MIDWYIDVAYYDILMPNMRWIVRILIIIVIWKSFVLIKEVIRKRILIQAFTQQMCDEISRLDIKSAHDMADKMHDTIKRFTIEILPDIYKSQYSLIGDHENVSGDINALHGVGKQVMDFGGEVFKSFLAERKAVRWALDGLDALIGDNKSIEVAWAKGTRYLTRYLEDQKGVIPWISTYMKLLNLPYNTNHPDFNKKCQSGIARWWPKGYTSLWIASHWFNYRKRLRYFELRGEDAWAKILEFKAGKPSTF